jgi:predicted  nucleic acid-binding Zn-ribbon protein
MDLKENKAKITVILFAVFITLGFTFFFLSGFFFSSGKASEELATIPGKTYDYSSGRTYELIEAYYSADEQVMEIIVSLTNRSNDGVHDYFWVLDAISPSAIKKAAVKESMSTGLVTVLRIEGLKPGYEELYLIFAPKLAEKEEDISSTDTAQFVINKYNTRYVSAIEKRSEKDYQLLRLDRAIAKTDKELALRYEQTETHQETIAGLTSENEALIADMDFLIPSEKTAAAETIAGRKKKIEELEDSIRKLEGEIAVLSAEKTEAENTRNSLL